MLRVNATRAVSLLSVCFVMGAGTLGCRAGDAAIKTVKIFDMLAAFPRATLETPTPDHVSSGGFKVAGESHPGIFLHPTSSILFPPVHVPEEAVLKFKIGVMEDAWDKAGDGVEFTVFVQGPDNQKQKVYSRYIDPKNNPDDRHWFDEQIPLHSYGDQDLRVTFATGPGPANNAVDDWGVWSEPQIVLSGN
jgi:hypothetical protein